MTSATQFLVGTASRTDPTLVKSALFYPPGATTAAERRAFYASHFPTVEVDASYNATQGVACGTTLVLSHPGIRDDG
jgi:uncharacterized protein YecE (DUF72 family)